MNISNFQYVLIILFFFVQGKKNPDSGASLNRDLKHFFTYVLKEESLSLMGKEGYAIINSAAGVPDSIESIIASTDSSVSIWPYHQFSG